MMGSSENPKRQANKALVPAIASSSSSDQLVPGTRIFACIGKLPSHTRLSDPLFLLVLVVKYLVRYLLWTRSAKLRARLRHPPAPSLPPVLSPGPGWEEEEEEEEWEEERVRQMLRKSAFNIILFTCNSPCLIHLGVEHTVDIIGRDGRTMKYRKC
ncbi:hypothetical protein SprV_0902716600 [Sparganum proliferum]